MINYILSTEPQWYIIVTRSNYEYKAKRDILNNISENNFINNIHDIFVPIKRFTIEYINSMNKVKHRIISKKILSLYVFINATMTKELMWWLKNLSSVATLLMSGNALCTLTEQEVNYYKQNCVVTDELYKGHKIIQRDDPFANDIILLKKSLTNIPVKNISVKKEKTYETNILNIIYKNAEFVHNKVSAQKEYELKLYKTKLLSKIYKDEKVIKTLTQQKKHIPQVLIDDRINFNQIDISKLKKLLNKYSLTKNFLNLDNATIDNINSYDLDKLKNLVAKHIDKKKGSLKHGNKKG